ncbi:MAG: GlcG protein [Rhodospirillaceae bacterium]|nr:GlcG protein [Rhodospirillaceae bacterium]
MRIKTILTLDQADSISNRVFSCGLIESMHPLAVAILDFGGNPIVTKRQDGAGILRTEIAIGKAWGALGMGMSSRSIRDRLADRPAFQGALSVVASGKFVPVPGGVLVYDDRSEVIGAVGVSGDTSEKDEYCAIEAIRSVGFESDPRVPSSTWRDSKL